ncbi:MAG TPA: hypothetical protein VME92_02105 [Acetobacteraceae bacterium]|nr:hypothetical protein [Acetobacteraceae bacterium]
MLTQTVRENLTRVKWQRGTTEPGICRAADATIAGGVIPNGVGRTCERQIWPALPRASGCIPTSRTSCTRPLADSPSKVVPQRRDPRIAEPGD